LIVTRDAWPRAAENQSIPVSRFTLTILPGCQGTLTPKV